jgi:hypothetical protein
MEVSKNIQSGLINFVPHPPASLSAYANLEGAMEMAFTSFRFLIGKDGPHHFSAPNFSGPSTAKPESSRSSTSSIEIGDEEISPSCITKPADSGKLADLLAG